MGNDDIIFFCTKINSDMMIRRRNFSDNVISFLFFIKNGAQQHKFSKIVVTALYKLRANMAEQII